MLNVMCNDAMMIVMMQIVKQASLQQHRVTVSHFVTPFLKSFRQHQHHHRYHCQHQHQHQLHHHRQNIVCSGCLSLGGKHVLISIINISIIDNSEIKSIIMKIMIISLIVINPVVCSWLFVTGAAELANGPQLVVCQSANHFLHHGSIMVLQYFGIAVFWYSCIFSQVLQYFSTSVFRYEQSSPNLILKACCNSDLSFKILIYATICQSCCSDPLFKCLVRGPFPAPFLLPTIVEYFVPFAKNILLSLQKFNLFSHEIWDTLFFWKNIWPKTYKVLCCIPIKDMQLK